MDLNDFSDEPLGADQVEADEFLAYLESILDESHVQFARDTLEGIRSSVEKYGRVTENQRRAVENIDNGSQRGEERRWRSRR